MRGRARRGGGGGGRGRRPDGCAQAATSGQTEKLLLLLFLLLFRRPAGLLRPRCPGAERRFTEEPKLSRHGGRQHGHEGPGRTPAQRRHTHATTRNARSTRETVGTRKGDKRENPCQQHPGGEGRARAADAQRTGKCHAADDSAETHQARLWTATCD